MAARVHMSKKELEDLIEETKAEGNDASLLEQLLAEVAPEKPAKRRIRAIAGIESREAPEELVTGPEELERLRTLACPHIRNSPFWEDFISRRVLVCKACEEERPGQYGEYPQPPLL